MADIIDADTEECEEPEDFSVTVTNEVIANDDVIAGYDLGGALHYNQRGFHLYHIWFYLVSVHRNQCTG